MVIAEGTVPVRMPGKTGALVVSWILGFGSLVAWNSMLTIGDYYYPLFPKFHPSRVLPLVYQPFALVSIAILTYKEAKVDTRKRNLIGYALFSFSTLMLLVIDYATSGKGGVYPFLGICSMVAIFGIADAHVQGGMVGDLAFMCPQFIQSFFAGLAASGAVTSALRMITKAAFENSSNGLRKGVVLFLSIATACEVACFFLYAYVFPKLPIVKHYRAKAASEGAKTVKKDLAAAGIVVEFGMTERLSNKELFFYNLDYGFDLLLIYVLTLSIFPGFLYENTGEHKLGAWYALVLVATYNVCDLIARYTPLITPLRLESRKLLLCATLMRFIFIPAFYFTSKYGDQGWMIFLVSLLGLTNGHLTVCVLMTAPKGYTGPEQNALGNILVLFILGGLFLGVSLDWLWLVTSHTAF